MGWEEMVARGERKEWEDMEIGEGVGWGALGF
jgi:hypothetical protein